MNLGYYPGCSLEGTARDYHHSIVDICSRLHINLVEIPDWNCCGASSAHMTNHELSMRLAIRNLLLVKDSKLDILIPCPACFQRLKVADKALRDDPQYWDVQSYDPDFELIHISTLLSKPEVLHQLQTLTSNPLTNMKVACYYGCLSLRPAHVTGAVSHEAPTTLEDMVSAIGAEPVNWSHRTECCSGSLTMTRPDIATSLVADIVAAARRGGATAMVTDCPMCQANVESRQIATYKEKDYLPVYYATEMINAALSGEYPLKQQKLHLVPAPQLAMHLRPRETTREESS